MAIDLKGVHFRTYSPQFDQNLNDGEYNPHGPEDSNPISGTIELNIIKFRAWQQNDIASDTNNNSDINDGNGGDAVGQTPVGNIGSVQPDGKVWPFTEILNV
jgi:hypothetical protein